MSVSGDGLRDNGAFVPGAGATTAPPFCGSLQIAQARMQFASELTDPLVGNRDARLFPAVRLDFLCVDDILVPVQRGCVVSESEPVQSASYWSLIPQFGRIWRQPADEAGWFRAAFPLMLVNDLENHAHQGLASFLYRGAAVRELRFQFVQQTAPYLIKSHFVAWGTAPVECTTLQSVNVEEQRSVARRELARRLPARPWSELTSQVQPRGLASPGSSGEPGQSFGPVDSKWIVACAWVRDGTLYYQESPTPCGTYPYPLEMRFGVRSVMKSVAAPLSLLRLAQVYGPYVLRLKIGSYLPGLHPKFDQVRFVDAANMASGYGGTGTWRTQPNDFEDGYLDGDYDGWYTAASHGEKLAHMAKSLRPYPWDPGTVVRYRDHDFYVLGAALNGFLKTVRGPDADVWDMLCDEVFEPIGIASAPAVRTKECGGRRGLVWFNAGYFPTLDDLAKIAWLYQRAGEWDGRQLLHRELTQQLLFARGALRKNGDASLAVAADAADSAGRQAGAAANSAGAVAAAASPAEVQAAAAGISAAALASGRSTHYQMGFHFTPYVSCASGTLHLLPTMWGSGESEVILYPNGMTSIRIAKAARLPPGERAKAGDGPLTVRAVERFAPF